MSENTNVEVGFEADNAAAAQNLLAAAERLGLPASVITTSPLRGVFVVPEEVANEADRYAADGDDESSDAQRQSTPDGETPFEDLKAVELDALAEAEGIDLTGHVKSKATRRDEILRVRAERADEAKRQEAADAASTPVPEAPAADTTDPDGGTPPVENQE